MRKMMVKRGWQSELECEGERFGFVRSMKKQQREGNGAVRGRILPGIDSRQGRQTTAQLFPKCHAGPVRLV